MSPNKRHLNKSFPPVSSNNFQFLLKERCRINRKIILEAAVRAVVGLYHVIHELFLSPREMRRTN